jgi:hypothetical protein
MINKTANENCVDNSHIRFNSKGCISLPDKLCPIDYSDVDKQWSENSPNIVFCDRAMLFINFCTVMNELPDACASCYNYFMCTGTEADINRNPGEVQFLRRTESTNNYKILTLHGEMIFELCRSTFKKYNYPDCKLYYFSRILNLKICEQFNLLKQINRPRPFHGDHFAQIVRIIIDLLLNI